MASQAILFLRYAALGKQSPAPTNGRIINSGTSKAAAFDRMKHGIGRLTATADNASYNSSPSKLTEISHKAPMRWLPLRSSKVEKAGAAMVAMSNYGAGLLPGDINEVHVRVQEGARLGVLTQGSNRIYKQPSQSILQQQQKDNSNKLISSKSTLQASVHAKGLLVVAPDPTVPFATSAFHQQQHFRVHPTASLIAVDWFSSGRYANGERWKATRLSTETKLSLMLDDDDNNTQGDDPLVWDATTLDQRGVGRSISNNNPFGFDLGNHSFNAFASVLLYGEQSLPVVEKLKALQYELAEDHTRIRRNDGSADAGAGDLGTTGRVLLGVNELSVSNNNNNSAIGPVHMARWVGTSNEDLYRMLHHSLQPLAPLFGLEFYQDRIRATSSGPTVTNGSRADRKSTPSQDEVQFFPSADVLNKNSKKNETMQSSTKASWNAYMLADSALPTGSFAHSAGLEAASQLGLLSEPEPESSTDAIEISPQASEDDDNENESDCTNLQMFVQASTRSTLQQATPWILAGHALGNQSSSLDNNHGSQLQSLVEEWEKLDRHVHAVMVCGGPACRASLDQGRNLLRVSIPWLEQDTSSSAANTLQLFRAMQEHINTTDSADTTGHMAPLLGMLGAALQLQPNEACHLLGYCVARDIVSAAVRLNLIGPLASVGLLSKAQSAAEEGITTALVRKQTGSQDNLLWSNQFIGGCAPVVDTVHPSHDLLAVRLFRT